MSTSKLQREVSQLLSVHLGQYTIRENIRPDWLIMETGERLELDFLIEEPMIAIEVQGQQHYEYIPHFHKNYTGFEAQLSRDRTKRRLCENRGVALYEVVSLDEALEVAAKLCPRRKVPIHPNAIKQMRNRLPLLAKQEIRYLTNFLFTEHERTPKKHLRRLLYALTRYEETGVLIPKEQRRIKTSLSALQQYQEAMGEIQFTDYEHSILEKAQVAMG